MSVDHEEVDRVRIVVAVVLVEDRDETKPNDASPDNFVAGAVVGEVSLPFQTIVYVAEWPIPQLSWRASTHRHKRWSKGIGLEQQVSVFFR